MAWFKKIIGEDNSKALNSLSLKKILGGTIFTTEFFRKQIYVIILICILSFFYVDNRFYCETQMSKVLELKKKIEDLKYESLTISAQLMNISRQSNVIKLVKEKNLNLVGTETPPVVIDTKKDSVN